MSELIPTIVLIIGFLLIALTLRTATRRVARQAPTRSTATGDDQPGR
jgi:hypothetical protein